MKLNKMASLREFVEQMPTQELDAMLQAELQKENIDDNLVRLILDVLESREMDCPVEYIPDAVEAAQKLENIGPRTTAKVKYPRVLKAASILLVAGLLLFALPRVAHAENLFELIARWTDSVFEFFNPAEPNDQPEYVFRTDNPGLQQVYDAVVEMGVTDPVVPMWIPEGYELAECKQIRTPKKRIVRAMFEFSNRRLIITVEKKNSTTTHTFTTHSYTKDELPVKKIEISGITHYLFTDNEASVAAWSVNDVECSVSIDCQEVPLDEIIKAIYTLEG